MGVDVTMAVVVDREVSEQELAVWNSQLHCRFGEGYELVRVQADDRFGPDGDAYRDRRRA